MVDKAHSQLSIRRQCELLEVNRNRLEGGKGAVALDQKQLALARRMDQLAMEFPEFGARRMAAVLSREGMETTRREAGGLMRHLGLEAVYRRPRTSVMASGHKVYPYLLKGHGQLSPDKAWCADITYIPMPKGYAYLVAVMDWGSRAVLGWSVSNTMETGFCIGALHKALAAAGKSPGIFNTDQGSQFTSAEWIGQLESRSICVSMDGRRRWLDNVFIERLWRAVKHEGIYLWAYQTIGELETALARWFENYNHFKPHQALGGKTPWEVYRAQETPRWKAAA